MKFGFFAALGLLFIALKLTGSIAWSWGWVLLPLYGPFAFALICVVIMILGVILTHITDALAEKQKNKKDK